MKLYNFKNIYFPSLVEFSKKPIKFRKLYIPPIFNSTSVGSEVSDKKRNPATKQNNKQIRCKISQTNAF